VPLKHVTGFDFRNIGYPALEVHGFLTDANRLEFEKHATGRELSPGLDVLGGPMRVKSEDHVNMRRVFDRLKADGRLHPAFR
jgi:hypothetical protein